MARREPLGVWLGGVHVADLTSKNGWDLTCTYTAEARTRWPGNAPVLSCSLPLGTRRLDASVFCAGLLPEGQHRQAMAAMAGVAVTDTHALLARFGRDVAGALVISATEPDSRDETVEVYTREALEEEIASLPERPLGLHDDSELSIAGLEDKLLLVRLDDGAWARPIHGAPSTHILKVEDRRFPGMAEAEASCLRLARSAGLTAVDVDVLELAGVDCLVVSRFDRFVRSDGRIDRVHQEDTCQALARDPEANRGRGKYQRAGGPALIDVAGLLDRWAQNPTTQLDRLVAAATYFVVIGDADAHGKNIALLHQDIEHVELAPLYDTVPTMLWPKLRAEVAMSIAGKWALDAIDLDDVVAEAKTWRHDQARARAVACETVQRLTEAASDSNVVDTESNVAQLVRSRGARLLR